MLCLPMHGSVEKIARMFQRSSKLCCGLCTPALLTSADVQQLTKQGSVPLILFILHSTSFTPLRLFESRTFRNRARIVPTQTFDRASKMALWPQLVSVECTTPFSCAASNLWRVSMPDSLQSHGVQASTHGYEVSRWPAGRSI